MIIINDKANITHLPYKHGEEKGVYAFVPGKNEVTPEVWRAVKEAAGEAAFNNHYGRFLRSFGEETVPDLNGLSVKEAVDLVKNTMALADLEQYHQAEAAAGNRKKVMEAITGQIDEIKAIEGKKS